MAHFPQGNEENHFEITTFKMLLCGSHAGHYWAVLHLIDSEIQWSKWGAHLVAPIGSFPTRFLQTLMLEKHRTVIFLLVKTRLEDYQSVHDFSANVSKVLLQET